MQPGEPPKTGHLRLTKQEDAHYKELFESQSSPHPSKKEKVSLLKEALAIDDSDCE